MIDDTDRLILAILQENARTPVAEVARRVGMAASGAFERIRKLEERGVIKGYAAQVQPQAVGLSLLAFVFVRSDFPVAMASPDGGGAASALAAIPGVQEVHHIAGEDCFVVKVRAADTEALGRLLRERFAQVPGVRSTRTTIVLETVTETPRLPIAVPPSPVAATPPSATVADLLHAPHSPTRA